MLNMFNLKNNNMIIIEQEIKPFINVLGKKKNIFTISNELEKKHLDYLSFKTIIGLNITCAVPVIEVIDGVEVKNTKNVLVKVNAFNTDEEIKEDIINQINEKLNGTNNQVNGE